MSDRHSLITREIAAARRRIRTHVEGVRRHLLTIERDIERGTSPTGEASNAAALLGRLSEDAGTLRVLLDLASLASSIHDESEIPPRLDRATEKGKR